MGGAELVLIIICVPFQQYLLFLLLSILALTHQVLLKLPFTSRKYHLAPLFLIWTLYTYRTNQSHQIWIKTNKLRILFIAIWTIWALWGTVFAEYSISTLHTLSRFLKACDNWVADATLNHGHEGADLVDLCLVNLLRFTWRFLHKGKFPLLP